MTTNYQGNKSRSYDEQKKSSSINDTLRMLDEASEESSNELKKMGRESLAYLSQAKDKVVEKSKEAAKKVDESAHESPWYFIGATAAIVGIAGFFLGRKSKAVM